MTSKTLLGCAITLLIPLFSYSQNTSRLFVPGETIYDTQNSQGGIGIDFDEPRFPLHIRTEGEVETSVKIDLVLQETVDQNGGIQWEHPKNAIFVEFLDNQGSDSRPVFKVTSSGRVLSRYMTGSEQIVASSGGLGIYQSAGSKVGMDFDGLNPEVFWSSSSRDLSFVNLSTSETPLTLNRNGKVGISTSNWTSNHNLHVEGGAISDYSVVQNSTDWGTNDDYMGMYFSDNPELRWKSDSTNYFEFKAADTGEIPLRLASSGKVGINTDNFGNSNHSLYIAGSSVAEEMFVKLSGDWGDFVFEKEYDLMPLDQLDDYLKENKHLPDFPSAAEIEKDGLPLGETERLLTIKVEELTLYILQLKAEIDELKKQHDAK